MTDRPRISAEALALCRDHPLASEESFLVQLSEALARLHPSSPQAERVAVLNKTTAEHAQRVDADEIAAARADERARVGAILALPEATGREASARHLALSTDMSVDAAKGALTGLPRGVVWGTSHSTPPASMPTGLRAADAPGGLVGMGADGEPVLLEAGALTFDPVLPRQPGSGARAAWKAVIGQINREGAKPGPAQAAK